MNKPSILWNDRAYAGAESGTYKGHEYSFQFSSEDRENVYHVIARLTEEAGPICGRLVWYAHSSKEEFWEQYTQLQSALLNEVIVEGISAEEALSYLDKTPAPRAVSLEERIMHALANSDPLAEMSDALVKNPYYVRGFDKDKINSNHVGKVPTPLRHLAELVAQLYSEFYREVKRVLVEDTGKLDGHRDIDDDDAYRKVNASVYFPDWRLPARLFRAGLKVAFPEIVQGDKLVYYIDEHWQMFVS